MKQRVELRGGASLKHQESVDSRRPFIMTGSWPCCQPLSRSR